MGGQCPAARVALFVRTLAAVSEFSESPPDEMPLEPVVWWVGGAGSGSVWSVKLFSTRRVHAMSGFVKRAVTAHPWRLTEE